MEAGSRAAAVRVAVGAAVVGAVTVAALGGYVPPAALLDAVGRADGVRLAAAGVGFTLLQAVRAARAAALLPGELRWWRLLPAVQVGFFVNAVLAVRVAILARPALLAWQLGIPAGAATAGIVVERLLDVLALAVLVAVLGMSGGGAMGAAAVFGSVAMVAVAVWAARGGPAFALRLGAPSSWVERVSAPMDAFADAARWLAGRPDRAALAVAHTAALWGGSVLAMAAGVSAFEGPGFEPAAGPVAWAAVQGACAAVPTPLALGVYEAAATAVLTARGAAPADAAAAALGVHLASLSFSLLATLGALPFLSPRPVPT